MPKRARPEGGRCGGGGPVVWSHTEAMKKPAAGGGAAVVDVDGGGRSRESMSPGKEVLGGPSWWRRGFWMSWSEVAPPAKEAGTTTCGGKVRHVCDWPEPEVKRARLRDDGGGEKGGDEEEVA
ncbi:hypothetical protein U9M48_032724 [Paspalum notatum var. saurae]|uniref:Uncharacterized protein n=1 Tax=Paspalum notatum var. saurae TaxID=547442 RepID=A0AAQ3U6M7_PASNO